MRVSELVELRLDQIDRAGLATVRIIGKGRRERVLPLWKETASAVKAWLNVRPVSGTPDGRNGSSAGIGRTPGPWTKSPR
jgi:integrase/recombinase XerD